MNSSIPTFQTLPPPPAEKTGWPWTPTASNEASGQACDASLPTGKPWPRISIVTPSFNQGQYLEETIRSVLLQGYANLEYFVMDGGSTDGSLEIIQKYSPWLAGWKHEKDSGQSSAINLGLARCTGEIFNWINSDDLLLPGALHAIARAWCENPGDILGANVEDLSDCGAKVVQQANVTIPFLLQKRTRDGVTAMAHQPGMFLPLEKVRQAGGVREDLHYNMDHFLYLKLLRSCQFKPVDAMIVRFRLHCDSKTQRYPYEATCEWAGVLGALRPEEFGVTAEFLKSARCRMLVSSAMRSALAKRPLLGIRRFLQACGVSFFGAFGELFAPQIIRRTFLRRD